jgi:hypothetical protein
MAILTEARRTGGFVLPGHNTEIHNSKVTFTGTAVPGQVVSVVGGVYVPFNQDGVDGSQTPEGIMWDYQDAVTNKVVTVCNRGPCEVNGYDLVWPGDATTGEIATAVAGLLTNSDIRVRYNT